MFDYLKKFLQKYRTPVPSLKGADRIGILKDVAYGAVKGTQLVDKSFGLSDRIANTAFKRFGPASPRLIDATDRVARNQLTAKAIGWATSGGPLTKAGKFGWGVGTYLDKKTGLSDRLSQKAWNLTHPGGASQNRSISTFKPRTSLTRGQSLLHGGSKSPSFNLPSHRLKLKLPTLGQSLARGQHLTLHTPRLHLSKSFMPTTQKAKSLHTSGIGGLKLKLPSLGSSMHRPTFSAMRAHPGVRAFRGR